MSFDDFQRYRSYFHGAVTILFLLFLAYASIAIEQKDAADIKNTKLSLFFIR